jgi:hypothetical protein
MSNLTFYLLILLYGLGFTITSMVLAGRRTIGLRSTYHMHGNLYLLEKKQGPVQFGRHLIGYFHTMWTGRVMRSTKKFALFSRSICTLARSYVDL